MSGAELHLKRLQNNCSIMLGRLVDVARTTCGMVYSLRHLLLSRDRRLAIYQQKKKEEEALAGYQKASGALLTALEIEPDTVASEPAQRPLSAGNSRGARLNTHQRGMGN